MMQDSFPYRRIVVVGTTSSGKSTLAKKLAERLQLNFIELDALHWEANWQEAADEVFRARVERAVQSPGWVVAGNYHIVRDLIWPRAEAIIWLDYPLPLIFWRLTTRTLRRALLQEELWNGNREKFWWHLKIWSDESLYHWLFKTYWRRKREFPLLFQLPEHQHLHILHFKSPRQTEKWLANLG
jgi:adenylate kinase family enzyme